MPPEARRLIVNKNAGETLLQRAARLGYEVSELVGTVYRKHSVTSAPGWGQRLQGGTC